MTLTDDPTAARDAGGAQASPLSREALSDLLSVRRRYRAMMTAGRGFDHELVDRYDVTWQRMLDASSVAHPDPHHSLIFAKAQEACWRAFKELDGRPESGASSCRVDELIEQMLEVATA